MTKQLTPSQVASRKKRIVNKDRSVSTERSITIQTNKGFMNIPTIVNGKQVSPRKAVEASKRSGVKRPIFKTKKDAVGAAKKRSLNIGRAIQKTKKR